MVVFLRWNNMGIIFAEKAKEIKDSEAISGNCRYADDSSLYAGGFGYDYLLNSALINGFLHRLTKQLEMLLHCNVNKLPIKIINKPNIRYNSKAEITKLTYSDKKNYVKKDYWSDFYNKRIYPFLYQKENVDDISSTGVNLYLTAGDVTKNIGRYYGHHAKPVRLKFADYQQYCGQTITELEKKEAYVVEDGTIPCFLLDRDNLNKVFFVSIKIPIKEENISVYAIAPTLIDDNNRIKRVITPVVNFEGSYSGNNNKKFNSSSNISIEEKTIFIVDNENKKVYVV